MAEKRSDFEGRTRSLVALEGADNIAHAAAEE